MNNFPQQVFHFNSEVVKSDREEYPLFLQKDRAFHIHNHLIEEVTEFLDASLNGDTVKAVDGIIDLMYLGLGTLYKMGLTVGQVEACMEAVHEANMLKRRGTMTRGTSTSSEDAVKPEGWVGPEQKIKEILGV